MRFSLLLAAIPLATAFPRGQPASPDVGVLERLRRLVRRGDPSHPTISSAVIPSTLYNPNVKLRDLRGGTEVIVLSGDEPDLSGEGSESLRAFDKTMSQLSKGRYKVRQTEDGQTIIEFNYLVRPRPYRGEPDQAETETEPDQAKTVSEPATQPVQTEATESKTESQPAPVQEVAPPIATETTGPSVKAAGEAAESGGANQTSYQTYLENLHNKVRAAHGNETPLRWSDDMYRVALAWASKCQFKHSDLEGAQAENIAFQTDAADGLEALKKSFQGWYYEEIPFVSFDEAGPSAVMKTPAEVPESQRYDGRVVPATVGHALNVIDLSYQEVGAASVFCDELTTWEYDPRVDQLVESGVQPKAWFTVGSYNGQASSAGGKLHAAADGAVPALDSISY